MEPVRSILAPSRYIVTAVIFVSNWGSFAISVYLDIEENYLAVG